MNTVETKFQDLIASDRADVDPALYTGSILESQEGYDSSMREFENVISGTVKESLRTTPIIYKRNVAERLRKCVAGKGIDFGYLFEHKYSREDILTIVVSENAGSWTYESSSKQDDGTFLERSASLSATDSEDLLNSTVAEIVLDVAYYANKRLTFE
jgi:hypothetical protein